MEYQHKTGRGKFLHDTGEDGRRKLQYEKDNTQFKRTVIQKAKRIN